MSIIFVLIFWIVVFLAAANNNKRLKQGRKYISFLFSNVENTRIILTCALYKRYRANTEEQLKKAIEINKEDYLNIMNPKNQGKFLIEFALANRESIVNFISDVEELSDKDIIFE